MSVGVTGGGSELDHLWTSRTVCAPSRRWVWAGVVARLHLIVPPALNAHLTGYCTGVATSVGVGVRRLLSSM